MDRRRFIELGFKGLISSSALPLFGCDSGSSTIWSNQTRAPNYLSGFQSLYDLNPKAASLVWFRNANYGLFVHYGLNTLLGRNGWVMRDENIPLLEYMQLMDLFTAENFDADAIAETAISAGMKYVTYTVKHHEGFCHWATDLTDFTVMGTPAKRDLVFELSEACNRRGLGLFLYYSYAADWHHPYFPGEGVVARSRDRSGDPSDLYKWQRDEDTYVYHEYAMSQIEELLTRYGPIAGIWLDPMINYHSRPDIFPVQEIYDLVSVLQPQCLVSFKQGATGTEDFVVSEWRWQAFEHNDISPEQNEFAAQIWEQRAGKPGEISMALSNYFHIPGSPVGDEVFLWENLEAAASRGVNLLAGTGLMPSGALENYETQVLRNVGDLISSQGFPVIPEGEFIDPPPRPT